MATIKINGVTYPEKKRAVLPGPNGEGQVFDLPEDADIGLNGVSTRPVQNKVIYAALREMESDTETKLTAIRAAVGSPLTAATKAAMTDTSKVYVYTGSESGMTAGNWYYHNGSVWVSGGVYNAAALETDESLSVRGSAADAQIAGSLLGSIRQALDLAAGSETVVFRPGYISVPVNGEQKADVNNPDASVNYMHAVIPYTSGDSITMTLSGGTGASRACLCVDAEGNVLYKAAVSRNYTDHTLVPSVKYPATAYVVLNAKIDQPFGAVLHKTAASRIKGLEDALGMDWIDVAGTPTQVGFIGPGNVFSGPGHAGIDSSFKFALIPVDSKWKRIEVLSDDINAANISLLASDTLTDGTAPDWASGETGRHTIAAKTSARLALPEDCTHIYVQITSGDSAKVRTPAVLAGARSIGAVSGLLEQMETRAGLVEEGVWRTELGAGLAIVSGGIMTSDGTTTSNGARARLRSSVLMPGTIRVDLDLDGFECKAFRYSTAAVYDGSYLGCDDGWAPGGTPYYVRPDPDTEETWLELVFRHKDDTSQAVTEEDRQAIREALTIRSSSEVDTSISRRGMAADAGRIGRLLEHMGWIGDPVVIQGARQADNSISSTLKDVCFAAGLYVGRGTILDFRLDEPYGGSISFGPSADGPWTKTVRGDVNCSIEAADDYLMMNLSHSSEDGTATTIRPGNVAADSPLSIVRREGEASADWRSDAAHPENQGVYNFLRRVRQMLQIQTVLTADLPRSETSVHDAGTTLIGLPYSSVWNDEMHFVPQVISFHTWATAAKNPNSYLYTRQSASAQRTYYGHVCSTFADYALGIDRDIPATYNLYKLEGMTELAKSVEALKIGDLLRTVGHVAVVTDIIRETRTGAVIKVSIAEGWSPVCRTKTYTPSQFAARFWSDGYTAYRWAGLPDVTYEPSPWVHLSGETEEPVYSTHLSPRRGDKANWEVGETVEVDVLDNPEGYGGWRLYRNGSLYRTGSSVGASINFENLIHGSYRLCLTDGNRESESVYWIVIDHSETFEALGAGEVSYQVRSENAVPVTVSWNDTTVVGAKNAIAWQTDLDGEAGETVTGTVQVEAGATGETYIRAVYLTEYGLFFADRQAITVT